MANCFFKKDSPAAIIHYQAALALAIPESPVLLKVTRLSHLSRALQAIAAKEPEKPASQVLLNTQITR